MGDDDDNDDDDSADDDANGRVQIHFQISNQLNPSPLCSFSLGKDYYLKCKV